MMEGKDSILALFSDLYKSTLNRKKVFLGQPQLSKECAEKRLKLRMYDALFGALKGPHNPKCEQIIESSKTVRTDLFSHVYLLREKQRFDEANTLNCLFEDYFSGGDDSGTKENVVKFLLKLTNTGSSVEDEILGSNVFKPQEICSSELKQTGCLLPAGPRNYGDSKISRRENDHFFTHFPNDIFSVKPIEPTIETTSLHIDNSLFNQLPGTGLPFIFSCGTGKTEYDRRNQSSLFGALVHSTTSSIDVKLEIPALAENTELNGFHLDLGQSDEGYESTIASPNSSEILSSDSGRGTAHSPDLWEMALDDQYPAKILTWETVGKPLFVKSKLYITEMGPEGFDRLYRVHAKILSLCNLTVDSSTPELHTSTMEKIVHDAIYLLIGIPSTSFRWDTVNQVFSLREGLCIPGLSPEAVRQASKTLVYCGTHYLRLDNFAAPTKTESLDSKGLVFQAFTDGIRRYLQHYRGCILSLSKDKTLLELTVLLRRVTSQIHFLAELCGCAVTGRNLPEVLMDGQFPTGIALLSYLYDESLDASNCEHYPVLLSLLHCAAKPYLLFIQDWVFHGNHTDIYKEFLIHVNDNYLDSRDENYWKYGFSMTVADKAVAMPLFLNELTNEIFVCGKSINLLRIIDPNHFLFKVDKEMPTIRITFSEEDLTNIEIRCRIYTSKLQEMARQLSVSREQLVAREALAKNELVLIARQTAALEMEKLHDYARAKRIEQDRKKRKLFSELKSQMESELRRRITDKETEKEEDIARVEMVAKQEMLEAQVSEDLKDQVREEIIEYYSKLSEEATKREQRAMWHVRRTQLHMARQAFLEGQNELIEKELLETPFNDNANEHSTAQEQVKVGNEENKDDLTDVLLSNSDLPSWAQKANLDASVDTLTNTGTNEPVPVKGHPSNSSVQSVLYHSESKQDRPHYVYATDKPHPSQTSVQGLLQVNSDVTYKDESAPNNSQYATLDKLKEMELLHKQHAGDSVTVEVNKHPSSSSIQDLMYSSEAQCKQAENVVQDKPPQAISQAESEINSNSSVSDTQPTVENTDDAVHKMSGVQIQSDTKSQTAAQNKDNNNKLEKDLVIPPKDKFIGGTENTLEGTADDRPRPTVKLVDGKNICDESSDVAIQHKTHLKLNPELHPSKETTQKVEPIKKPNAFGHVSEVSHSTYEQKITVKPVAGKNASDESKPIDEHLKYLKKTRFHPSTQSMQKVKLIKKASIFGHASELSGMEYDILAPKLKKRNEMHSSLESDYFSYQIKACRKKVVGRSVHETSKEPSPYKPKVRNDKGSHASYQSEYKDLDHHRMIRFKELNVFGHSSDSSAQRLLYGDSYGSGKSQVISDSDGFLKDSYSVNFFTDTEVLSYRDNFDMLTDDPKVDLLAGHFISDISGKHSIPSELDDDISAHMFSSLSILLQRSVAAPLVSQISLVNQNVLNLFHAEYNIQKHFEAMRCFMFMQDGEFGQSLSDQLFDKLSCNPTVHEFFNPVFLNAVLQQAMRTSLQGDSEYASNISFMLRRLPSVLKPSAPDALAGLELTYKVDWPLNIVITDLCLSLYSRVFTFMLLLKRVAWSLKDVWHRLKRDTVIHKIDGGEEYRKLQLYRHEMQHFVNVIQGYIANQVIHVSWQEFQNNLQNRVHNLDDLHDVHLAYLTNCKTGCLLNSKAKKVMDLIESIFALILKFHMQLSSHSWQQSTAGELHHKNYEAMCNTFKSFKEYSKFLFKVVSKLATRSYHAHLHDLVLRLNFNGHFKS